MIKVFGIGNILLGDDGIGVKVIQRLKECNYEEMNFFEVGLDLISYEDELYTDDYVVILDNTRFNKSIGTITVFNMAMLMGDNVKNIFRKESFLESAMREVGNDKVFFIGIEGGDISYSLELSQELQCKFDSICESVLNIIIDIAKGKL